MFGPFLAAAPVGPGKTAGDIPSRRPPRRFVGKPNDRCKAMAAVSGGSSLGHASAMPSGRHAGLWTGAPTVAPDPASAERPLVISRERQRPRNPGRSHGKISRFARNDRGCSPGSERPVNGPRGSVGLVRPAAKVREMRRQGRSKDGRRARPFRKAAGGRPAARPPSRHRRDHQAGADLERFRVGDALPVGLEQLSPVPFAAVILVGQLGKAVAGLDDVGPGLARAGRGRR